MKLRHRRDDYERGSAVIEAVVGITAFVMLGSLVIAGGRVAIAHQAVQAAASEAARSASIARTQPEADARAAEGARTSMANQDLDCVNTTASVDTSDFGTPVGQEASVTATVTCTVNLSDVALPMLPGSMLISKTMSSPIDTYREH